MSALDLAELLEKFRTGYPPKSAFTLFAAGFGIGWAVAWLILHQRLKHLAEVIDELRGGLGDNQIDVLQEERCTLSISWPNLYKDPRYQNHNRWRIKVHNNGPAMAANVQVKLMDANPGPRDPNWGADFPYPVYPVGTITNDPAHIMASQRQINPNGDEDYEIICGLKSEAGQFFTTLNTKGGGHNQVQIEPSERWELSYELTAKNADSIAFILQLFCSKRSSYSS